FAEAWLLHVALAMRGVQFTQAPRHEHLKRLADQLLLRVAEQVGYALVRNGDAARLINGNDSHRRAVHKGAETGLAVAKLPLKALALCHLAFQVGEVCLDGLRARLRPPPLAPL